MSRTNRIGAGPRTLLAALAISVAALAACSSDEPVAAPEGAAEPDAVPATPSAPTAPPSCTGASCAPPPAAPDPQPLRVRFLGVQGFLVEHGNDVLLTSPLFTRPNGVQVTTGLPVTSDAALVARGLSTAPLGNVRAILSGHAHYDHLLDTPLVMARAPSATLFSNRSAKNLLAAFAPDRGPACAGKPVSPVSITRKRVVAMDDPAASVVDYRGCPSKKPAGAPLEGKWVPVPGAPMRVLAVCSEHQDQIGPIHYGEGDVVEEQCTPPKSMNEWKEGVTLGYLVDFLDAKGAPLYRVYYEDSPAGSTIGQVPKPYLTEKRIDLALLCVGTYDNVEGAPGGALTALNPRFALGGHWEDFLRSADDPLQPIPFLDVAGWDTKAKAAMHASGEATKMLKNGQLFADRVVRPQPGDTFEIR